MNKNQTPWPAGIKKTRQRACVYSILQQADIPLSAAEVYKRIAREGSEISLSTVYRILEFFAKENLAATAMFPDNATIMYTLSQNQHKHYAVCMNCHKVIELENCPLEHFVPQLSEDKFHVTGHRLELYGYCKDCEKKKNPS